MVKKRATSNSDGQPTIRPKSSLRKGRSDNIDHVARQPLQARSAERFEKILTAAEELLQKSNIEDISFYDIARQAKISPASVNYLFPTSAALRIELNRRYLPISTEFAIESQSTLVKFRNPSWQHWLYEMGSQVRQHYNANRHISETILGPALHRETQREAIDQNRRVAETLVASLRKVFILPEIPGLVEDFAYAIDVVDALFGRSYVKKGTIDDQTFDKAIRMQIAYLRTILPETLSLLPDEENE